MNKLLENRISMYYKVKEFFTNNLATLATTATGLTPIVTTFNTKLTELQGLVTLADQNNSGYATQKQNNRESLRDKSLAVAGPLWSFAKMNNNEILAAKVWATKSDLDAKRDTDILFWCNRMKNLAIIPANSAGILPLGVTAAMLTSLTTSITAFEDLLQEPADRRSEGVAAGKDAETKIVEIDKQLTIIDGVMTSFRTSNSLLYNQYNADRLIDDNAAGIGTPDVVEPIEAGTIESIYNIPYVDSRKFKLNNTSSETIEWGLSDDASNPTNSLVSINPNTISELRSDTLAPSGDFLIIRNTSTVDVIVEMTIVE